MYLFNSFYLIDSYNLSITSIPCLWLNMVCFRGQKTAWVRSVSFKGLIQNLIQNFLRASPPLSYAILPRGTRTRICVSYPRTQHSYPGQGSSLNVAFCLYVKTRLGAKPLTRKRVPPRNSFSCKSNSFSCERFAGRLVLKRGRRYIGNGLCRSLVPSSAE